MEEGEEMCQIGGNLVERDGAQGPVNAVLMFDTNRNKEVQKELHLLDLEISVRLGERDSGVALVKCSRKAERKADSKGILTN